MGSTKIKSWMGNKLSVDEIDVRDIFETCTVEETQDISKRINGEIEKKKEELRILVGERYRDLINAADTIGTMMSSSNSIVDELGVYWNQINEIPSHLALSTKQKSGVDNDRIKGQFERATELKILLEIPRNIHISLNRLELIQAFHLYNIYTKLSQKTSALENDNQIGFTFGCHNENQGEHLKSSFLECMENLMNNFDVSSEKLAECLIVYSVLESVSPEKSCSKYLNVVVSLLSDELKMSPSGTEFIQKVSLILDNLHKIFIDPEIFKITSKQLHSFQVTKETFFLKRATKTIEEFKAAQIFLPEAPNNSQLTTLIRNHFLEPLKSVLDHNYHSKQWLVTQKSLCDMKKFENETKTLIAQTNAEELMRVIYGSNQTVWSEVFYPSFIQKCQDVCKAEIGCTISHLQNENFDKLQKSDEVFDMVNFVWKTSGNDKKSNVSFMEIQALEDLKLKCVSPQVAKLCEDLEERLNAILKDYMELGDLSLKEFLSSRLFSSLETFFTEKSTCTTTNALFLGRVATTLPEMCLTTWKILTKEDAIKLRKTLQEVSENSWKKWCEVVLQDFKKELRIKLPDLQCQNVSKILPVAEEFVPDPGSEETIKPSVQVPYQISNFLYSLLFDLCLQLGKVGPQSIPQGVLEFLRHSVGHEVVLFYDQLTSQVSTEETPVSVSAQLALQFTFDVKFLQWMHVKLGEVVDPLVTKLQGFVDPFDLDIVNPRLKSNLKRFLFENHLTLGLLFGEESHSFIAQNLKTKQIQSLPIFKKTSIQLPLLPL